MEVNLPIGHLSSILEPTLQIAKCSKEKISAVLGNAALWSILVAPQECPKESCCHMITAHGLPKHNSVDRDN